MPQNSQPKKARSGRASTPARGQGAGRAGGRAAAAAGSRSPKHRGYRADEAAAPEKKARWSREERVDRGHAPERSGRKPRGADVTVERTGTGRTAHRPDWRPQKDAANERPARRERSDRPARAPGAQRPAREARPTRAPRAENRDAGFYPSKPSAGPVDDVVLERLEADAVVARDVEGVSFGDLGLGGNITRTL